MLRTTRTFERGHMRPYYSTADMPLGLSPGSLGDLLFWFDGDDATSTAWLDKTNTYSVDTTPVTITDGHAVFTGAQGLPIGILPMLDQWSIFSLVRPTSTSSKACIMSNDVANYNNDVIFGIANPPQYGLTYHSISPATITDISVPEAASLLWSTVALVADNETVKLYVNGVMLASATKTFNFTYGDLSTTSYMGGSGQGKYWVGNIKDLLFYQSAIDSAGVQRLHEYLIEGVL